MVKRSDFIDKRINTQVFDLIRKQQRIPFLCNNIVEDNYVYHNGQQSYALHAFGILPCGSKICVTLVNIPVYFVVKTSKVNLDVIMSKHTSHDKYVTPIKYETVYLYPAKGFSVDPHEYTRVYFKSKWDRNNFINILKKDDIGKTLDTAEDDTNYINQIIGKYKFASASWNSIIDYEVQTSTYFDKIQNCDYYFKVNINNIRREENPSNVFTTIDRSAFIYENLLVMSWDIETIIDSKLTPTQAIDDTECYNVFMICATFSWQYSDEPFRRICITQKEIANLGDLEGKVDIFVRPDEKDRIIEFANILRDMAPDVLVAFNGSSFDWPAIWNKMMSYEIATTLHNIYSCVKSNAKSANELKKFNYHYKKLKINAEKYHESKIIAMIPGIIDTDCMPVFLKIYSSAEIPKMASLNYFLEANEIEKKDDLDYRTMKIYFATNDPIKWGIIAHYCVKDCYGPMRLYKKRNIISEKREFATLAYVEHKAAYYNADGMKVCNLAASIARDLGIAFSNHRQYEENKNKPKKKTGKKKDEEVKIKFEGAHVFDIKHGVNRRRPIAGNDFAGLYPSVINGYNLSTDMVVTDKRLADSLMAAGYSLIFMANMSYWWSNDESNKMYNDAWFVQHNNVNEEGNILVGYDQFVDGQFNKEIQFTRNVDELISKLPDYDTTAIEQLRFDEVKIPKVTYKPKYGRKRLKNERFGLQAVMCKMLIDLRAPLKRRLIELQEEIEKLEKDPNTNQEKIKLLEQERSIVNAKQLAVKIMNNTIYGQMGSPTSPLYMLVVAQAVTAKGRESIKLVGEYLVRLLFTIIYGDTDSVYPEAPDEFFAYIDKLYADVANLPNGIIHDPKLIERRIEYWDKMVKMVILNTQLKLLQINEMMLTYSRGPYLSMAYEEVGMPSLWCGKKKYAMIQHVNTTNFYPKRKHIFLRGLEMKKQGQNKISVELGYTVLERILHPSNNQDPLETALEVIDEFKRKEWNIEDFIIYKTYKADKKNVTMNEFVQNMKKMKDYYSQFDDPQSQMLAKLYEPPEDQDKVPHVLVKVSGGISITGSFMRIKASTRMCPLGVFKYLKEIGRPLEIDYALYLKKALGNIARMCSYKFYEETSIKHPNLKGKKLDAKNFDITKKYLEDILLGGTSNKSEIKDLYQKAYNISTDDEHLNYMKLKRFLKAPSISKDIFKVVGIKTDKLKNFDDIIAYVGSDYVVLLKNLISEIVSKKGSINPKSDIMDAYRDYSRSNVNKAIIEEFYKNKLEVVRQFVNKNMKEYVRISQELSAIANRIAIQFKDHQKALEPMLMFYEVHDHYVKNLKVLELLEHNCDELKQLLTEAIVSKMIMLIYDK